MRRRVSWRQYFQYFEQDLHLHSNKRNHNMSVIMDTDLRFVSHHMIFPSSLFVESFFQTLNPFPWILWHFSCIFREHLIKNLSKSSTVCRHPFEIFILWLLHKVTLKKDCKCTSFFPPVRISFISLKTSGHDAENILKRRTLVLPAWSFHICT